MVLPSRDEPAEVVHPREGPFHFPSPAIAPQFASILSLMSTTTAVSRDHFDFVPGGKLLVGQIRVVGSIADEPSGELIDDIRHVRDHTSNFCQESCMRLVLGRVHTNDIYLG